MNHLNRTSLRYNNCIVIINAIVINVQMIIIMTLLLMMTTTTTTSITSMIMISSSVHSYHHHFHFRNTLISYQKQQQLYLNKRLSNHHQTICRNNRLFLSDLRSSDNFVDYYDDYDHDVATTSRITTMSYSVVDDLISTSKQDQIIVPSSSLPRILFHAINDARTRSSSNSSTSHNSTSLRYLDVTTLTTTSSILVTETLQKYVALILLTLKIWIIILSSCLFVNNAYAASLNRQSNGDSSPSNQLSIT